MDLAGQLVIVHSIAQLFDNLVGRNEVITSDFLSNKPERSKILAWCADHAFTLIGVQVRVETQADQTRV